MNEWPWASGNCDECGLRVFDRKDETLPGLCRHCTLPKWKRWVARARRMLHTRSRRRWLIKRLSIGDRRPGKHGAMTITPESRTVCLCWKEF